MPSPLKNGEQAAADENISQGGGESNPPADQSGGEQGGGSQPPVTVTPKKVELTEEELNEKIQAALAAANEQRDREERERIARETGNVQQLLDDREAELKRTRLALWRSQALVKHGLNAKWFDALNGESEKDIDNAAKALKKRIDEEVAARETVLREEAQPPVPPHVRGVPPQKRKVDGETRVKRDLGSAFNIGGLTRRNYNNG